MKSNQLNLSPLQLNQYFFRGLEIEPQPWTKRPVPRDGKPAYPSFRGQNLEIKVEIGKNKKVPRNFGIRLEVSLTPSEKKPFPYQFRVAIEGWFSVLHAKDDLEAENIATINGAGVLFGTCREVLLSLSHRFSNGPLMLPTVDFRTLKIEVLPSAGPASDATEIGIQRAKPSGKVKPQTTRVPRHGTTS